MYDASAPPAVAPAGMDAVAFYIGGDTPHVWTDAELARQGVRYRLPIWVRSNPVGLAEGTAEANQAVNWMRSHNQPKGTLVALDYETAVDDTYLAAFDRVVVSAGYLTTLYGSRSSVRQNTPRPSGGYWDADWTFTPHLDPGSEETQYSDKGPDGTDLSLVADNAPLWDTHPTPTPPPPPPPRSTVYTTKTGDTLASVSKAFGESAAALAAANPNAPLAPGAGLTVPVPAPTPPQPPTGVPTIKLVDIQDAAQRDPLAAQGVATHAAEVTLVQQALEVKGFLTSGDGHGVGCFGTVTVAAYAKWQASLGYSGSDADGVPGALTLSKLGHDTGKFLVDSTGRPVPPPHPTGHSEQPIALSAVTYGHVADASLSRDILPQVFQIMGITNAQAQLNWERGILTAALRESSYNLNAINTTDLNAHGPTVADGHPEFCSRGVLQCIPPTFADHHESGTSNDIYDGVANVCAAMNYVMHQYGVSRDGHDLAAKVEQFDPNRAPRGY